MNPVNNLDNVSISLRSRKILQQILEENPVLDKILKFSANETEASHAIRNWILPKLKKNSDAFAFYMNKTNGNSLFGRLGWRDIAAIRILDYIDHAGEEFSDLNIGGDIAVTHPVKTLWLGANFYTGGAKQGFFYDMLYLFRQLSGKLRKEVPSAKLLKKWMDRYPSGIEERMINMRRSNRERIINALIRRMDSGEIKSKMFSFEPGMTQVEKEEKMLEWWDQSRFHLKFAVRSPELLNEMLDYSLDPDTMQLLFAARDKGIPFFVNPYYLSLLNVKASDFAQGADMAIRQYVVYSRELIEEFGKIKAWEKEDTVKPGEPNAAGWILPSHNMHRRYPEVAIFVPDTVGRACGGLCSSCQRMYDFQSGRYNFDLKKLRPEESWNKRLPGLLEYFRYDSQLRDILITGGDALMSSDKSLKRILDEILNMAIAKREDNRARPGNRKFAEIARVRIGTRLPIYIPQRITPELVKILGDFKIAAQEAGITQFVIQTHFISPLEVTPEAQLAVERLLDSGWVVTNQLVLTAPASRRGHTAKLRQALNEIGVLTYYTLTVKGYKENFAAFAPNARTVQEQIEEKSFGLIPQKEHDEAKNLLLHPGELKGKITALLNRNQLPFLSTDRNIINLPGVGKSLTFRTIGITRYGRRILEFDHDRTRRHSPIIDKMGKVIIIESKSIDEYLQQLFDMGEDPAEYQAVYGYSIGQTEPRMAMYEYPESTYEVTEEFTNLEI